MNQPAKPLTIFYTDDDPDDQSLFKEVVSEIEDDYDVYTQNHGEELMEMLKNPPPQPHIIFLDLNMPFKNGYEVLKEMRHSPDYRNTPVIIFSTSDDKNAIEMSKQLGADLFISKPASYTKLKETMRNVLSMDWLSRGKSRKEFFYTS